MGGRGPKVLTPQPHAGMAPARKSLRILPRLRGGHSGCRTKPRAAASARGAQPCAPTAARAARPCLRRVRGDAAAAAAAARARGTRIGNGRADRSAPTSAPIDEPKPLSLSALGCTKSAESSLRSKRCWSAAARSSCTAPHAASRRAAGRRIRRDGSGGGLHTGRWRRSRLQREDEVGAVEHFVLEPLPLQACLRTAQCPSCKASYQRCRAGSVRSAAVYASDVMRAPRCRCGGGGGGAA